MKRLGEKWPSASSQWFQHVTGFGIASLHPIEATQIAVFSPRLAARSSRKWHMIRHVWMTCDVWMTFDKGRTVIFVGVDFPNFAACGPLNMWNKNCLFDLDLDASPTNGSSSNLHFAQEL